MKYIKEYNQFKSSEDINEWFTKKSPEIIEAGWEDFGFSYDKATRNEITKIEELGFQKVGNNFVYESPSQEDVKSITFKKYKVDEDGFPYYYYEIKVVFPNGKEKIKRFNFYKKNAFEKCINFIKSFLSEQTVEFDSAISKYNL